MTRFVRFAASSGLTNLADGVATVAWAWLASLLTRDPFLIALVPVALRLPWFAFAIPAGVTSDRMDRRALILRMDALRAVAFGTVALSLWSAVPLPDPPARGVADLPVFLILVAAALLVGVAEVYRDNAAQTMIPSIVPHDQLERANGRLWSVELTGNALVGPAVGALLIGYALPLPFALNALAYVLAIVLLAGIRGSFRPQVVRDRNWRAEVREGFAFLAGAPLLRTLAWITGFWNLLFQMVLIALILHVQENLNASAFVYGLILAAGAVGGILGGMCGDAIIRRLGPGTTAQWMLFASAPAFLAIGLAPGPVALAIVLLLFEFTGLVWNTVSVSYRQRAIPDHLLGRVNSLYRLLAWGMMPIGLLLSGLIARGAEQVMARELALMMPFFAAAAGALILAGAGWRGLGRGFAVAA